MHYSIATSRVVPLAAAAFEQKIGFARPPAPGRVLRDIGGFGSAPDVQDGIDESPSGFHAVTTIKKRGVASNAIPQESGIRAPRAISERFTIAEVH